MLTRKILFHFTAGIGALSQLFKEDFLDIEDKLSRFGFFFLFDKLCYTDTTSLFSH